MSFWIICSSDFSFWGRIIPSKIEEKSKPRAIKKVIDFSIDFFIDFGWFWPPTWTPNCAPQDQFGHHSPKFWLSGALWRCLGSSCALRFDFYLLLAPFLIDCWSNLASIFLFWGPFFNDSGSRSLLVRRFCCLFDLCFFLRYNDWCFCWFVFCLLSSFVFSCFLSHLIYFSFLLFVSFVVRLGSFR